MFIVAIVVGGFWAIEACGDLFEYGMACAITLAVTALMAIAWGLLFSHGPSNGVIQGIAAAVVATGQATIAAVAAVDATDSDNGASDSGQVGAAT